MLIKFNFIIYILCQWHFILCFFTLLWYCYHLLIMSTSLPLFQRTFLVSWCIQNALNTISNTLPFFQNKSKPTIMHQHLHIFKFNTHIIVCKVHFNMRSKQFYWIEMTMVGWRQNTLCTCCSASKISFVSDKFHYVLFTISSS